MAQLRALASCAEGQPLDFQYSIKVDVVVHLLQSQESGGGGRVQVQSLPLLHWESKVSLAT